MPKPKADKLKQIEVMHDAGFTDAQIISRLSVRQSTIDSALGRVKPQTNADRRAERKEEYEATKEAEKEEQPKSARHVVDEELFKQVKEIQANGGGLAYTAEVTGFSQPRISRIRGCKTFEEYKQKGEGDLARLKANYQSNKNRPINKTLAAMEELTLTLKEIRDQLTRIADYQEPKKRGWFHK